MQTDVRETLEESTPSTGDLVARVRASLRDLASADIGAASDEDLRDALEELARAASQLHGVTAAVTAEFDARRVWLADGAKSPAAWLRHRGRLAPDDAARQVRHARHLRTLPATAAALAAGAITPAAAGRIIAADTRRTAEQLRADEETIVGWAEQQRFDRFCAELAGWREAHDPDGGFRTRPDGRRFHCTRSFQAGWILDGWLDPLNGTLVSTELDRRERELFLAEWSQARDRLGREPTADELARTPAQRRADALVEMAKRSATTPAHGQPPKPLITILTGHERFARMCELIDGTRLSAEEAAALLHDSVIEHITFDGPDRPIAVSTQRSFTGALRRAIIARDRECTLPLCDEPSHRCQVDHRIEWSTGGETSSDNGRLLCGHHNRRRNTHPPPDN